MPNIEPLASKWHYLCHVCILHLHFDAFISHILAVKAAMAAAPIAAFSILEFCEWSAYIYIYTERDHPMTNDDVSSCAEMERRELDGDDGEK